MPGPSTNHSLPRVSQRGAALMLLLLLVGVGALAVFVTGLNSATQQQERDRITAAALAQAKEALIGYALKRQDPERPGDMPCPDNPSDGDYDGTQDSPCGNDSPSPRLGRLPWRSADVGGVPVDGLNADLVDGFGERLWYAVSRNLVDAVGVAELNPGIISVAPRPWITVHGASGQVISNRVALVVLSAGLALGGQNRTGMTPNVAQFLDQATIGAIPYNNNDANDCLDGTTCPTVASRTGEDFIMNVTSPTFNDRLIYLTIDELMVAVERRVAGEISSRLPHPYPDTLASVPSSSWPSWFNDNNWLASITYVKVSDDKVTVSFLGCSGRVFSMDWISGYSVMKWVGNC